MINETEKVLNFEKLNKDIEILELSEHDRLLASKKLRYLTNQMRDLQNLPDKKYGVDEIMNDLPVRYTNIRTVLDTHMDKRRLLKDNKELGQVPNFVMMNSTIPN